MKENSFKRTLTISIAVAVVSSVVTVILTSSGITDFFQYDVFKYNKPVMYEVRNTYTMDDFDLKKYYPLEEGNTWTYDLSYATTIEKNTIKSFESNINMEIIDSIEKGRLKLVMARGNIFNINYFGLKRGSHEEFQQMINRVNNEEFIFFIDSNKVLYTYDEKIIEEIINFFQDENQITYQQDALEVLFDFPLFDGQVIGSTNEGTYRTDGLYSRIVSKSDGTFDGPYYYHENDIFALSHWTMPDDSAITFVPYIGITNVDATHHGTVGEYKLSLKEYRINQSEYK